MPAEWSDHFTGTFSASALPNFSPTSALSNDTAIPAAVIKAPFTGLTPAELPSILGKNPLEPFYLQQRQQSLIASASPKTFEEVLFDANASCKMAMSFIAMHLNKDWKSNIFAQLDDLHDFAEWYESDKPTELSSFKTFLRLILHVRPAKKPGLGLTQRGEIVASWSASPIEPLTLICNADDQISWSLLHLLNGEKESAAGCLKVRRLLPSLQPYEPNRWFF